MKFIEKMKQGLLYLVSCINHYYKSITGNSFDINK